MITYLRHIREAYSKMSTVACIVLGFLIIQATNYSVFHSDQRHLLTLTFWEGFKQFETIPILVKIILIELFLPSFKKEDKK